MDQNSSISQEIRRNDTLAKILRGAFFGSAVMMGVALPMVEFNGGDCGILGEFFRFAPAFSVLSYVGLQFLSSPKMIGAKLKVPHDDMKDAELGVLAYYKMILILVLVLNEMSVTLGFVGALVCDAPIRFVIPFVAATAVLIMIPAPSAVLQRGQGRI